MKHANTDTIAVINRAKDLLDAGHSENAMKVLTDSGMASPAVENARGICLLRLGRLGAAMNIFRDLVFPNGAFSIPDDMPTVLRVNYVTSLLLMNNMSVGMQLLREIPDKRHPLVLQLKNAVRDWKKSLPWWRRILLPIGLYPDKSFRPDFVPGAIWLPEDVEGPRPAERAA